MSEGPTARAQPFYCPYCGEQDIRPAEAEHTFHCSTCDRTWELRFLGLGAGVVPPHTARR